MAFFGQLGQLLHQYTEAIWGGDQHTNELNEDPNDHNLPSTRDTVDHESRVSAEAEVLVDGGSEVVAIHQYRPAWQSTDNSLDVHTSPLTHRLDKHTT
jgi:hypothetical protein